MAALRLLALRRSLLACLLGFPAASMALNSVNITTSTASPDCLNYRVVGICYWLFCTPFGCKVRTTTKVRHYIPDAVVSSYTNTGGNPWRDVSALSPRNETAQSGANNSAGNSHESPALRFKNADVVGHPGGLAFSRFAGRSGYTCAGAGKAFMPYLLSTLDTLAWRYGIPEAVYPESLTPGVREVGSRAASDLWGNVYPRSGFLQQTDDYKAAAVIAQRAGDIVTRRGQVHVYQPLLANKRDGYWPAGELKEADPSTGKWQELTPLPSSTCAVFPHHGKREQAKQGDFAWALWRPYSCCKRAGQTFLGSVDTEGGER
ncbi:TIGR03756 family integrating conjugative element protein [Pseudomonas sp. NPDC089422]|uniref:TIGR03756 family integrating conjugative element protein n=1 Tax=Pseudomonas sp. NPDC089422 TaxID=3364466 RepID=UPI00382FBAD3